MRAGKLRHRITIQDKTPSQNTFGEEDITWTDVATVWAAIVPLRGREFLDGKMETAEITTRIEIRHRDGIRPEMRVVHGATIYDIHAVIPIETRDREIHLMSQEIVN
jgi:SPP1 family predicted phage head-tail adaptor